MIHNRKNFRKARIDHNFRQVEPICNYYIARVAKKLSEPTCRRLEILPLEQMPRNQLIDVAEPIDIPDSILLR